MELTREELVIILKQFLVDGKVVSIEPLGNGHINTTYLVTTTEQKYVLQRVNTNVFKDPHVLMGNINKVTKYLYSHGVETLRLVKTKENHHYFVFGDSVLRVYIYLDHSKVCEGENTPELFEEMGKAFGLFISQLAGFDASQLKDTIPNFHNTPVRYNHFLEVVSENELDRVSTCKNEIQFVKDHANTYSIVVDGLNDGSIPLRVTHNDTKINNMLIDENTGKVRAIIDLDTIMPGSLLYDFGDSIRSGASTTKEDSTDLEHTKLNKTLFKAAAKGFLSSLKGTITKKEVELLPFAAYLLTIECGMRFLTDYLEGDVYFRIHSPEHNLIRARNQFALAKDIEESFDELNEMVKELSKQL